MFRETGGRRLGSVQTAVCDAEAAYRSSDSTFCGLLLAIDNTEVPD